MTEAVNEAGVSQPPEKYAFVKCWHPSAPLQVSIPIPIAAGLSVEDGARLLLSVDNLLAAGWLPQEARMGEGEKAETAESVVLWETTNRDNSITPCVDLYGADQKYRFLTVYLDTPAEREDFERVSGMSLASMQPYVGEGHIERGKNPRLDAMIYKAPHSFRVAHVANPKHNPNAANPKEKGAKGKFSRWPDLPPRAAQPAPATKTAAAPPTRTANNAPPANPLPNAQRQTGTKKWNDCTIEERCESIMRMADPMGLLNAKRWADGLPLDEGRPYLKAVTLRAFQQFQTRLSDAADETAIANMMEAVANADFGQMTEHQVRDLTRVADTRRQFLESKAFSK